MANGHGCKSSPDCHPATHGHSTSETRQQFLSPVNGETLVVLLNSLLSSEDLQPIDKTPTPPYLHTNAFRNTDRDPRCPLPPPPNVTRQLLDPFKLYNVGESEVMPVPVTVTQFFFPLRDLPLAHCS